MKNNYWAKFEDKQFYHVYNRGINRCNLFYTPQNYQYFLKKWTHYFHPFLKVYAFCLMPNHFHFLVSPNLESIRSFDPSKFVGRYILIKRVNDVINGVFSFNEFLEFQMKDFYGAYSKAINKQEKRTGSLFQQRFKRVLIKNEYYLTEKICYIHHNPIHHGFCKNYEDWFFSSYNIILAEGATNISREEVLELFNLSYKTNFSKEEDKKKSYIRFHKEFKHLPSNDVEDEL